MQSKITRFLTFGLVCLLLAAFVGTVGAQDAEKYVITGLQMVGGDIETIDPALSETSSSNQIIAELFIGLTHQNEETAAVIPGIAESWDISEDGRTYTFNLIPEIPWVRYNAETSAVEQVMDESGNPRYVTAQDMVYGWGRTLDPATASPYAYVLSAVVEGGVEYSAGEAGADAMQIAAVDDYTFEVTLPEPLAYAPGIYGLWMANPQPQWAIEAGGDEWTEPENINTYGPWALKEWAHDESITLIANPFWPGTDHIPQPMLEEVTMRFLDPQAQFAEYLAGSMDAIDVPLEELDRVRADPTLSTEYAVGARSCTYYLGFDNTEAPLDNANLRRALSLSIDRQSLVDNVTRGDQEPARWFSRPGLVAAPTMDTHPDLGIEFDAAAAQEALALALSDLGLSSVDELPALTASFNDASGHGAIVQAIQQMWADNLGLQVQLNAMDPTTYFSTVSEDAPMIFRSGWCQDYPDANNFLFDVFHSASSQNDPHYNNPEFDALIEEARVLTDEAERRELYAQAEEIFIVQDAGIAPIYWYTFNQLTKPYVERTASVIGRQHYERWDVTRP